MSGATDFVNQTLPAGSTDGLLAVAEIEIARYGEQEGQRFCWCNVRGTIFHNRQEAVRWERRQHCLTVPTSATGRLAHRYFGEPELKVRKNISKSFALAFGDYGAGADKANFEFSIVANQIRLNG